MADGTGRGGHVVRRAAVAVMALAAAVVVVMGRTATPAGATGWDGKGVVAFGDAVDAGGIGHMKMAAPAVALAATPDGKGYWVATAAGEVFPSGTAAPFGSLAGTVLHAPIVGMAATPDGKGYWLAAMDGGIFTFGNARFYGSTGAVRLNQPIVGMAATPDGGGYWLVAMDGGIFTFGDARFYGSTGALVLNSPIAGMAPTADGNGYWLVASDGGVFTFGNATYFGSATNLKIGTWVVGMAPTPDGGGYWLAAATGGVLAFGDAGFFGPTPNLPPFSPAAAIAATPTGNGYWLLYPDEADVTFSTPGATVRGAQIVGIAASQLGPDLMSAQGRYCNPYGPCEEWCALYATWVWEGAGIGIPRYPFTGSIYKWGAARGLALGAGARPQPGDIVLFGTGPQNAFTSVHTGIVAQVWPNGAVVTIEGDSGPEPDGQYAVTMNGPFLPAFSKQYNDAPVYAFVDP
ncbi:MAG TPA: CHAP domain-containing protein [Acidimicrobiales bacterium]|nr:CHAP domain-containing protein [Acidimicrobiales bacterium]